MGRNRQLAQIFGDLAMEMQGQTGSEDTLRVISEAAARIVPGARWAGISRVHGECVISEVPTDHCVTQLDQLQTDLGDGPSLTALRDHLTIHIDDMTADERWPRFAARAVELGVRSLLSFQLFVQSGNLGALNIYGGEPGVFSADSMEIGLILAQHAAVAMVGVSTQGHFESGLASRDVIGQAKGILMQRDSLTGVQAFALLTRASQQTNVKLVDVARWLVAEHEANIEQK